MSVYRLCCFNVYYLNAVTVIYRLIGLYGVAKLLNYLSVCSTALCWYDGGVELPLLTAVSHWRQAGSSVKLLTAAVD